MTAVSQTTPKPGEPQLRSFDRRLLAPSPQQKSFFASRAFFWSCFLALFALGIFLRFWRLGEQAYWTDEGHTVVRINGNFTYMLNELNDQGFPPGWYALLRWWLLLCGYYFNAVGNPDGHWIRHLFTDLQHQNYVANGQAYTTVCLRALPAFFGALTVPAMYFLARQFTDRKGALLVMLLAAVNPFMIYYARDIKMYSPLVFFAALSTALLLQWLTTQKHVIWFPLYVAAAFCMTATDYIGLIVIALHLIFVLTRPRPRPFDAPLWLVGAALASWFSILWYIQHKPASDSRVSDVPNPQMDWIVRYTDMNVHTLMGLPTVHILGYLWPINPPDDKLIGWFMLGADFNSHLATRSSAAIAAWEVYCGWALFAVMIAGLVPWERLWKRPVRSVERRDSATRGRWWWVALWTLLPVAFFACTWIDQDSPWYDTIWGWKIWLTGHGVKPLWEPRYLIVLVPGWLLWLGTALRRLPTLPLRGAAILFFTGVCTVSALSNHLVYRNPPYHRADAIALRYMDPKNRPGTVVAGPATAFPSPAHEISAASTLKVVPGSSADQVFSSRAVWTMLGNEPSCVNWLRSIARTAATGGRLDTIVMTDRYGDETAPTEMISDDALLKVLNDSTRPGAKWKLVDEESYRWYYEWRFYIFHTWRTRVWQLETVTRPPNPAP